VGDGHVTLTDEAGLIVAVAVLMKAPRRRAAASSARPARARRVTRGKTAGRTRVVRR
jgi:hypothetical protein